MCLEQGVLIGVKRLEGLGPKSKEQGGSRGGVHGSGLGMRKIVTWT